MPMEINSKAYHYIETDEDSFSVSLSNSEAENAACGSDEERSALGFHVIGRAGMGSNTPIMIFLAGESLQYKSTIRCGNPLHHGGASAQHDQCASCGSEGGNARGKR